MHHQSIRRPPPPTQLTPSFGSVHDHCTLLLVRCRPYNTITDGNAVTRTGIANILGIWDYLKNSGLHPESKNMGLTWIGQVGGKREGRKDPRAQSPPSANDPSPTATPCQSRPACVWDVRGGRHATDDPPPPNSACAVLSPAGCDEWRVCGPN